MIDEPPTCRHFFHDWGCLAKVALLGRIQSHRNVLPRDCTKGACHALYFSEEVLSEMVLHSSSLRSDAGGVSLLFGATPCQQTMVVSRNPTRELIDAYHSKRSPILSLFTLDRSFSIRGPRMWPGRQWVYNKSRKGWGERAT